MTITAGTTVGVIATEHPLATRVLHRHGIDYCRESEHPLELACAARGIEIGRVLAELETELAGPPSPEASWEHEPLPALIDHILKRYHEPLREELPRIAEMARKVQEVHGEKDPERFRAILDTILALSGELELHMLKEEEILFPMIRGGQGSMAEGPIAVMEQEHEQAKAALQRLRELTDDHRAPEDACTTWRALWAALADLDRALHEHIHLENDVLHVRALAG